ncbi:MAG: accessory Sec system translocase SecA2 [Clostridia bacterium]|nr:accessory Sec system translocase SecA2 [Clostridia bacterium]
MSNLSLKMIETIGKYTNIDTSEKELKSYQPIIRSINSYDFSKLENSELLERSRHLKKRALKGVTLDELLVEAYALVKGAASRTLKIQPFDVQLLGAIGMHKGKLIEMQTGEGKTLSAVFCAYLNALTEKGVHVLTFNDYLAKRDAEWMGPVYYLLGLSVGFVQEGMSAGDRRKAYNADITYLTAKEAGFDYLRSFLCYSPDELVQRPFHCAIIDEADSILIDEARVPLIIAGSVAPEKDSFAHLAEIIKKLIPGLDYDTDEYQRNVFLTDSGADKIEQALGCGNIYSAENISLLCAVNSALHAEALLQRDIDYIVRDGKIELVDEFTGRVADKRHWPDGLQTAVEAKEGLEADFTGRILGSTTLQYFLGQYPKICGMTATARTSADELMEFYGVDILTVPTNRQCIRIDYPDIVFTHKEAKYRAIVNEAVQVHAIGRPILIGTASIEESIMLADALKAAGVECNVLNAKNDELEAEIIARAGEFGAVTVSTNMAGRGTDIRLGGPNEQDRGRIAGLGGLYVIGTNRHESLRIDNQLRGRAGRQGDPGSSRFFISLEDDLIIKFGIKKALPEQFQTLKQEQPIDNPVIRQRISHIQKVVEGQNFEIRKTLRKYAYIVEEQRKILHQRRRKILMDQEELALLKEKEPEKHHWACSVAGKEVMQRIEKQLMLFHIDKGWADHLDYVSYLREGIHLVSIAGKDPLDEFAKQVFEAFDGLMDKIELEVVETFRRLTITKDGVDFEKEGLKGPTSTWTYLISDDYFKNNPGLYMISGKNLGFASIAVGISWPLLLPSLLYNRFRKKSKKKNREG